MRLAALVLLFLLPLQAAVQAEVVVAGLSQNRVSITANFDGTEILIFGAIKREAPIPSEDLDIIITVEGPKQAVTVRRKERFALIWVNRDWVEVDAAPSFYAVATTAPLSDALRDTEDLRHHISIPRAIRLVGVPATIEDASNFTQALIRIREEAGLYQLNTGTVDVLEETLFRTSITLPSNLVEGNYKTRVFLAREGRVVNQFETVIFVQKVGLERFLHRLAYDRPLIYGLLSLFIAIAAGWAASTVFRYLKS